MPDNSFIEKLIHVSGIATWHDNRPESPDADFSRKSIVYGFNGTGKTSLSRVFSSLEANCLADGLGGGARFQVKFSDGTIATETDFSHPLGNHFLVFNSDFVSRNFSWDEGAASPIFHIDEANIEKVNELRQFETKLETALAEAQAANTRQNKAEKEFQGKGTEIGARVREFRGTGYTQQFNRRNVDAEYSEREFTKEDALDDNKIDELRAIIRQPEPRSKINLHFELPEDFRDGLEATCDLLQRDFAAQLTSDLAAHPKMLAWVADGHQYHEDHRLGSCLYCGNDIPDQRRKTLEALFSDSWQTQTNALQLRIDWCERLRLILRGWLEGCPDRSALQPNLVEDFDTAEKLFRAEVMSAGIAIKELQELLVMRKRNPLEHLTVPEGVTKILKIEWFDRFSAINDGLLEVIAEHNAIHDHFHERKEIAANALKAHVLFGEQSAYRTLKRKASEVEEQARNAEVATRELGEKAVAVRNAVRKHGVAADELNDLIHEYLGHNTIRLEAKDEGYQLVRADGSVAQNLSEGEKTALTFCFFLTQFGAEGRDKKKLVVVIDDPVSSLDSNAQTYAFGLIKKHTKRIAQVVLLTHNLKFMHMAKREFFKGASLADEVPLGLLFVDCRDAGDGVRTSSLVRMPSHLAMYDSEYQYLFSIVFDASDKRSTDYLYLMPNAVRKLLEIFTAFAAPDKGSFAEALLADVANLKLMDEQGNQTKLSQVEMNQLERVCQIESHGDIEAVNSLPALTIEESLRAADGALKYIRARDRKHYDAMLRIVKKIGKN